MTRTRTRRIKIGELTVVIENVPDDTPNDTLKMMALLKIFEIQHRKALSDVGFPNYRVAG